MIVPKGYHYYIDSIGNYHLQAIQPLQPYNFRVEVLFPVSELIREVKEPPKVMVNDISKWLLSLNEYLSDENHILYNVAEMLITVARNTISYELCGGDLEFTRVVALYVGHHLEFHFKDLKDENYLMSLQHTNDKDSETKEVNVGFNSSMGEYKRTIYGRQFWTIYGQHAKFLIGYMPL